MSTLESDEEIKVKRWCQKNNVLYIKFTPRGERGWADRVCIFSNGKHVWLEMKREGKELRKLQLYRQKTLRARGVAAHCADTAAKAIDILEGYCTWEEGKKVKSGSRKPIKKKA